ncbi:Sac2 family protein [Delitschia confertaspora ATCC 74209]|uniref:Sac2 family protein n=1 Tax=Delitschia confertaspora ATCC 74209 TaxID=1513339 RepID=A0A9P4MPD0_9PLEO|nr:Sac2 family protein [Delitschia confertaspora ATCC 74209]
MWLDRFAHSTPSGTPPPRGSSYSPAPRRPYPPSGPGPLSHRPSLPHRSSSLQSLATTPASSSTSLPSTARLTNGAGRRRDTGGVPQNIPDPLRVLESIIGGPSRKARADTTEASQATARPQELVEDIDFGRLSLQEYAEASNKEEQHSLPVHIYSAQPVEESDKEKHRFEDLHRSIIACDGVLKSVETYLTNFQSDLGVVSTEIESLQNRSIALNTKLENRKVVEKLLGPAVEDISVSPAVVKRIAEGPIDDVFVKALSELEKRSKTINTKFKDQPNVKAIQDIKPLIEDLTNKAVERIRDHVVAQIKALRSPSINAQIIQQQAFVKFKDLFAFLAKHQPQLAQEISQAYIYTMRWYYLNHFTRYQKALEKLKLHSLDNFFLLGQDDAPKRGTLLGSSRTPLSTQDPFSLGRRIELLKSSSANALTAYLVEEEKGTHYLEVPFRTFNLALIDNASFEYTFLTTYFSTSQNYHAISRTFSSIFSSTLSLGQALTKQLTESTTDTLGILLCVRLNQHFAFELQRRKVPTMDNYINATNMLLWPRFQQIMDAHCTSLRHLTTSLPTRPSTTSTLLSSSTPSNSTAPTSLTQRFANLIHGILSISSEAGDDEPVSNSVARLRSEFEAYLTRLSKGINDQRKRERFLYNNYSLVGTIIGDVEGKLAEEMRRHFEGLRGTFEN